MAVKGGRPKIGEMRRNRVVVCNWREMPDDDVSLIRSRPKIYEGGARIKTLESITARRSAGFDGFRSDVESSATHIIDVRNPSDVMITPEHWVYVERRFNRREWYRIVLVQALNNDPREDYLRLYCRLDEVRDERADPVTQPEPPAIDEPERDAPPKPKATLKKKPAERILYGGEEY